MRPQVEAVTASVPDAPPIPLGTMVEVPRAALTAGEIAREAEFFSFGTNDLTQMTWAFSRDDVEAAFFPRYMALGVLAVSPFESLDVTGVGRLVSLAVQEGRATRPDLRVGVAGSTAEIPPRSTSSTPSASTTSRAPRSAFRWRAWKPVEPRWTPRRPTAGDRGGGVVSRSARSDGPAVVRSGAPRAPPRGWLRNPPGSVDDAAGTAAMTGSRSRWSSPICLVVLVLVLGACQGGSRQPAAAPRVPLASCTVDGVSAQCGTLDVPEDRAARTGRTIRLRLAVLPARAQPHAPDPVFWLAGGPGGAATDSAAAAAQLMERVNEHRDVVLVDQRGTGGSNDLRCPQGTVPSRWAEELRSCLARLAGDPRDYTTASAMDDLDDVRAALGYDRIDLYGISYGVTAAQVYLQRHPAHVRSAILESGTVLAVPIYERFPAASRGALDVLFARCAADSGCHSAFPDPATDLRAVTAQLDRGADRPADDRPEHRQAGPVHPP